MRAIVIGYGNTLRGDDGIGPAVAERVRRLIGSERTRVFIRQILTPDLAGDIEDSQRVVFIDASMQLPPGTVSEQILVPEMNSNSVMVHSLTPSELLGWCSHAYGKAPEAILIAVGGFRYELGESLSPEIRRTVRSLVTRTLELTTGIPSEPVMRS